MKKVLARLGYASGITKIDTVVEDIILDELELSKKLISPKYVLSHCPITLSGPSTISLGSFVINSKSLADLLSNCVTGCGFAVTIGSHLEEKRDAYARNKNTTRALVLDAIGSEMVDYLAGLIDIQIQEEANKDGLKTTRRFSPGYGDWPVSGQTEFLKWLGAKAAGISLSPACQMTPEKSVSAILGVYK